MSEKISGYLLLVIGLIIILISAFQVYQVFTGAQAPLSLSNSSGVSASLMPGTPPVELIPAADINELANITLTYLLMTFLVTVGYKISSLGVQLLRPIEVKLSAKQS